MLSAFSVSTAAHACYGIKGHEKSLDTNTHAKKQAKKAADSANPDQKS